MSQNTCQFLSNFSNSLFVGDAPHNTAAEKDTYLNKNFGIPHWKYAPGSTPNNAFLPKNEGFSIFAIIQSTEADLTSSTFFNPANARPLSGSLQNIIMQNLQDIQYLRGTNAPQIMQNEIINIFSDHISKEDTYFNEDLKFNPTKSNSNCASPEMVLPYKQTLWAVTDASRGRPNTAACRSSHQYDLDEEMEDLADNLRPIGDQPHISEVKMKNSIDNLVPDKVCPKTSTRGNALSELQLETTLSRKRKLEEDPHYNDYEWSTTAHFQNRWLGQMRSHQSHLLPIADIDDNNVKSW